MPKRMTVQQLDQVRRTDPKRMLDLVQKRAAREAASADPLVRFKGHVTQNEVDAARTRMRTQH